MDVDAAPACSSGDDLPQPCPASIGSQDFVRNPRIDAGAEHLRVQLAADGQHRVADFLGAQPAHVEPRVASRSPDPRPAPRRWARRHAVCGSTSRSAGAAASAASRRRPAPPPANRATPDASAGCPGCRSCWASGRSPGQNDAARAVGHHPRRQRIRRRGDPVGQRRRRPDDFAPAERGGIVGLPPPSAVRNAGSTSSPGTCGLPRDRMNVFGGSARHLPTLSTLSRRRKFRRLGRLRAAV